jgi:hypothetical protein
MARQADDVSGEMGELGRTTDTAAGEVEQLNQSLKDIFVDSHTGILGVAGSIERVQNALQDTDDSAEDLAKRFGQGGVFATAQAEAEDLAAAIKRNLKDAFSDAFDDGGQGLQDLVGDADQLKERLSEAFGSIQSNVSASASAQGDSVLDYFRSLNLSNLLQFNITRTGAQTFEFSWGLPDKTAQADPDIGSRREFVYNDQASNNAPEAWVRNGTSRAWLPIFTSGEQVRLQGPTSDELVEISSVTYDPSTDTMSVSVTDSPSLPSSSGSISSDVDRMTYAFFFHSTT